MDVLLSVIISAMTLGYVALMLRYEKARADADAAKLRAEMIQIELSECRRDVVKSKSIQQPLSAPPAAS